MKIRNVKLTSNSYGTFPTSIQTFYDDTACILRSFVSETLFSRDMDKPAVLVGIDYNVLSAFSFFRYSPDWYLACLLFSNDKTQKGRCVATADTLHPLGNAIFPPVSYCDP